MCGSAPLEVRPITVKSYEEEGAEPGPFEKWLSSLDDRNVRMRIEARLARLRGGSFGDCKGLGDGVHEMRLDIGPGYRIYFGRDDFVLILLGGTKSSQSADIPIAKSYWAKYKEKKKAERGKDQKLRRRSPGKAEGS